MTRKAHRLDFPPPSQKAASRFFDNYLNCLINASIPEKQRPWCVKRIEAFITAQCGHKIKGLCGEDISRYLDMIGRQNRLAAWQFRQIIDAIRILYCDLLRTGACQEVDWQYWLDSARQLEHDHPTTARQLSPEELSYIKERKGEGALNRVRETHRDLIVRFAIAGQMGEIPQFPSE